MRTQSIRLALAIVLICPYASGQWLVATGPYGGHVTCLAVSGSNLFAGTSSMLDNGGGVFLSTNDGTSWTAVNSGLDVITLAVSGMNLFAVREGEYIKGIGGVRNSVVLLSTNNGASWTEVSRILLRRASRGGQGSRGDGRRSLNER
jgi:hypothetical protein